MAFACVSWRSLLFSGAKLILSCESCKFLGDFYELFYKQMFFFVLLVRESGRRVGWGGGVRDGASFACLLSNDSLRRSAKSAPNRTSLLLGETRMESQKQPSFPALRATGDLQVKTP